MTHRLLRSPVPILDEKPRFRARAFWCGLSTWNNAKLELRSVLSPLRVDITSRSGRILAPSVNSEAERSTVDCIKALDELCRTTELAL